MASLLSAEPFLGALGWELDWARPFGLAALALPLLLWLLAKLVARPQSRATGALAIWRAVERERPTRGERRRRRVPLATWLAIAALAAGALALAGPRALSRDAPRVWTMVLDHSPSTALAPPGGAEGRRLDQALGPALAWLASAGAEGDRVRWVSAARASLDLALGERPSAAWLAHPRAPVSEPRFELFDQPGALWVTDVEPRAVRRAAGLFASGARQSPGPIGYDARDRIDWDGETVATVKDGVGARSVALVASPDGDLVPEVLARMLAAWAGERGLVVVAGAQIDAALDLAVAAADELERAELEGVRAGRDGWSAEGDAPRSGIVTEEEHDPGEPWLVARAPDRARARVLVDARPGRVRVAWRRLGEPSGDPAAFAVSWSELFDRMVLPPEGVVAYTERSLAGEAIEAGTRPPEPLAPSGSRAESLGATLEAWLALAAGVLATLAVALGLLRRG